MNARAFWQQEAAFIKDTSHLGIGKNLQEGIKTRFKIMDAQGEGIIFYEGKLYIGVSASDDTGTPYEGKDPFVLNVKNALNNIWSSKTTKMIVRKLQLGEKDVFTIRRGKGSHAVATMGYWDDENPEAVPTEQGSKVDSKINLIHELGHLYNFAMGNNYSGTVDSDGLLPMEEEETAHLENLVRSELKRPLRIAYSAIIVKNRKRIYGAKNKY
jgi:hypothetical protein